MRESVHRVSNAAASTVQRIRDRFGGHAGERGRGGLAWLAGTAIGWGCGGWGCGAGWACGGRQAGIEDLEAWLWLA